MSGYFLDWLSLIGRCIHLVTGIAWIGASFYFVWLDDHLLPPDGAAQARGVGGELWAVHGGGFYHSQKYRVAPAGLPPHLHWFYWEAYSTFLSGLFLMCVVYYGQAQTYLIDPAVAALTPREAVAIGVAFIAGGWVVYDLLCRTALAADGRRLGITLAGLLAVAAWGLCHLFSGRGAFIEFGAMLGTIMVANVFFVIIPGQRQMVRMMRAGREPDPRLGARGKLRSVHNTYFTLPVLFTMISNHYALLFGARYNWLVLIAAAAAGALIRLYFVMRHRVPRGEMTAPWPALAGLIIVALLFSALIPVPAGGRARAAAQSPQQQFGHVQMIVAARCMPCHAEHPTQAGMAAPPKGLLLDTPDAILAHALQMRQQLATNAMPPGNATGISTADRALLIDWIDRGALH
ncbi:MAG TPA: urate hydroxylase PuuD [Steroidobacteraceae bacterium]|nr:urate hydroxylase PuuD [Steroidobacteraceae bacterium]